MITLLFIALIIIILMLIISLVAGVIGINYSRFSPTLERQ